MVMIALDEPLPLNKRALRDLAQPNGTLRLRESLARDSGAKRAEACQRQQNQFSSTITEIHRAQQMTAIRADGCHEVR